MYKNISVLDFPISVLLQCINIRKSKCNRFIIFSFTIFDTIINSLPLSNTTKSKFLCNDVSPFTTDSKYPLVLAQLTLTDIIPTVQHWYYFLCHEWSVFHSQIIYIRLSGLLEFDVGDKKIVSGNPHGMLTPGIYVLR